jgi:AraC-like DNA-binding protein
MSRGSVGQDPELLRRLLRAKDRMDFRSHEAWPVRRLARVSGVSEAHFARSFKQAFGVPSHRYLLTRRIERATALLRDTDLSITTSPSTRAGGAWVRSGAPCATSPARPRAQFGCAGGQQRASWAEFPLASSAPRNGPTSGSQFRRSGAVRQAV